MINKHKNNEFDIQGMYDKLRVMEVYSAEVNATLRQKQLKDEQYIKQLKGTISGYQKRIEYLEKELRKYEEAQKK